MQTGGFEIAWVAKRMSPHVGYAALTGSRKRVAAAGGLVYLRICQPNNSLARHCEKACRVL